MAALALRGGATAAPPPGLVSAFRWKMADPLFGGFSAIHVYPGGARFLAVSDRGAWTEGRIARDARGRITGLEAAPMRLLRGQGEAPLDEARRDAEGMAVAPDGTLYISFEGATRVLRYARPGGPAENLPTPDAFRRMQLNSSLEALAVAADGTLYTLPERSGRIDRPFPVWRFRGGRWDQPFTLPRRGEYLAVSADIGPDGRFYLLERDFRGLSGFSTRLRRFDLTRAGMAAEATLIETPLGTHGNLEGLSVWRDGAGRLIATMIADDNFHFLLRSEIVEYALPD